MALLKRKKVLKNIEIRNEATEMYTENAKDLDIKMPVISKEEIIKKYDHLSKKHRSLINTYYQAIIYSKIASKDNKFNIQMLTIDKHINRFNRELKAFYKDITFLEHGEDITIEYIEKTSEKLINIDHFYHTIKKCLDEVMQKYFGHMKIATANICMNRSNEELEIISQNLNNYLNDFNHLQEAAEYIFFNSSHQILKTIDSLIKLFNNEEFTFNYFLKSDDIITLELTEWIDLYNKIRFVIKKAPHVLENDDFKNNYFQFETSYLILMLNMEAKNNQIKNFRI